MDQRRLTPDRRRPTRKVTLLIVLVVLLFGAGSISGYVIDYQWWKELGQTETWLDMLWYGLAPVCRRDDSGVPGSLIAHARGMKFAEASLEGESYLREDFHTGIARPELFHRRRRRSTPGP